MGVGVGGGVADTGAARPQVHQMRPVSFIDSDEKTIHASSTACCHGCEPQLSNELAAIDCGANTCRAVSGGDLADVDSPC